MPVPAPGTAQFVPLRPPHVPALAGGGTLLPGLQRGGLPAPRHPVTGGRRTLRTGVWVSPNTGLPQRHAPTSLILPEHHHVVLLPSLHKHVSIAATGLTRASVLVLAATYHPRHLHIWVRVVPRALHAAVARKLSQHPPTTHHSSCDPPRDRPRPDIVTLSVQMSLRPKLRALDVLLREYQSPLTLHVQEAGPPIGQRLHPLYHTIPPPAKVAGGRATLLYRALDLTVTSHSAHPSGRALVVQFTVAGVTRSHANVYFPADGDLDTLQEILD